MKHQTSYLKRAREMPTNRFPALRTRKTGPEPERGIPSPTSSRDSASPTRPFCGPGRSTPRRSVRTSPSAESLFRRAMRRVNLFRFEPGTVYLFTESRKIGPNAACTACSTAWTEGKSNSRRSSIGRAASATGRIPAGRISLRAQSERRRDQGLLLSARIRPLPDRAPAYP